MIKTIERTGTESGPTLLLTGRIHGDEPVGTRIIERLIREIDDGILTLAKGTLKCAPICNQRAADANTRYLDMNLNRVMSRDIANANQGKHEADLAHAVMDLIDGVDMLIDLHSFPDQTTPAYMICVDDSELARDMVKASAYKTVLCASDYLTPGNSQMTIDYAKSQGRPAILIEAGYHEDPDALERGYNAVVNVLATLGFLDKAPRTSTQMQNFVVMTDYILQRDDCELVLPLATATSIKRGDPIYKTRDGQIITSDKEGTIFAKNMSPKQGEEYCYIADITIEWPKKLSF